MRELFLTFLRLGCTSFGGPAAHIALFENEFVKRKKWLSAQEFTDLMGATQLIPGPNSTEMVFHIGLKRAGVWGLLVSGLGFIGPAALIVGLIAHAYKLYGGLPDAQAILYGIRPVLIALVVQALWRLFKTALPNPFLRLMALFVASASLLGAPEIFLLLGSALVYTLWPLRPPKQSLQSSSGIGAALGLSSFWGALVSAPALPYSLSGLSIFFLKVGALLFGSGYTLIAFLRGDLVDRWRWISEQQLLDAVAVGQFTPGPLLTSASFIGYLLSGFWGAVAATVAIFLPGIILVILSAPHIARLRRSTRGARFLDAVNAASWSLMLIAGLGLAQSAVVDLPTAFIAGVASLMLLRFSLNSAFLVVGGALLGWGLQFLR